MIRHEQPKPPTWWMPVGTMILLLAICPALLIHFFLPSAQRSVSHHSLAPDDSANEFPISAPIQPAFEFSGSTDRPAFPYAVLPGGARNGTELRDALRLDPVAASHYAGFAANRAQTLSLEHPRQAYVSYRLENRIYWTSHKISLHAGETLLTDGTHFARAACGNRISESPSQPTHPEEPPESVLNRPLGPRIPDMVTEPFGGPPAWQERPFGLTNWANKDRPFSPSTPVVLFPTQAPVLCCLGPSGPAPIYPSNPPGTGPIRTPEPEICTLLLVGLACAVLLYKFPRR